MAFYIDEVGMVIRQWNGRYVDGHPGDYLSWTMLIFKQNKRIIKNFSGEKLIDSVTENDQIGASSYINKPFRLELTME